jgi:hypothetical protein
MICVIRCPRYLPVFAALLFVLCPGQAAAFRTETHRYLQQSGEESYYFDWILAKADGYLLRAVSTAEEHRTVMDETMATRLWSLTNPAEDTEVEARRVANRIELKGRFHGEPLDMSLAIDDAPWFQSLSTSLRSFLADPEETTEFWTLRPDKLTVHKVRAIKKGRDVLDLGQHRVEAQKIEVRLIGLASLFGRGNYWFRASDRLLLHYRGPSGLPGIPCTTITLEPPL